MKRFLLFALAALAGLGASEIAYRLPSVREVAERFVYRDDDSRMARALSAAARDEVVSEAAVQSEVDLLCAQFGDEAICEEALRDSALDKEKLRGELRAHIRERAWLEKQTVVSVNAEEARASFDAHPEQFALPQRYRASHIFLAAPAGTATEVTAEKQSMIQGLGVRLLAGEKFEQIAEEASEDEATKKRGGDLGYFSAVRMPAEFMAEIEKLQPGEISAPVQSHLGFHILRLTETKAPRPLSFEETRPEIELALANAKRVQLVAQVSERLRAR